MRSHRDQLAGRLRVLLSNGNYRNLNAKLSHEIKVFNDLSAIHMQHAVRQRRNHSSDNRFDADDAMLSRDARAYQSVKDPHTAEKLQRNPNEM